MTPLLIFDGDCGFCRVWIDYWKCLTGDRVAYEPYQKVAADFPAIPLERFAKAVHLALPDGRIVSGAEAVFQTLALVPGRHWPLALYRHIPGFASGTEWIYALIAAHRPFFFKLTKLLFGRSVEPASYGRVQWLFLKLLGAIYGVAFLSLAVQITGLIGSDGILPVKNVFKWTHFSEFPTLFWLNSTDFALKSACYAGVAFSILLIAGIFQRMCLIGCWALYLSLTTAGQDFLAFQWDTFLLETGFLAIFLGFSPVIVWMFRWLLFRLMLMSGAAKLLSGDTTWRTLTALRYHYETQPLPTPIAWYMRQLPGWSPEISVVVMFAIELGAPFLIFAPRRLRFFAGIWIVFLQVMIFLTGNYTFFNLLTIALCVFLLDDQALGRRVACPRSRRWVWVVVVLLLFTPKVLAPFNLTGSYGLFAVMTTLRHEVVVEGSNDGLSWREYEFKYIQQAPRWIAPHQPRLDWQMWFAALGSYRTNPWFVNFVYRLLQGSPDVIQMLGRDPFPDKPPKYIRALVYDYTFARDKWWKRELRGSYLSAVSLTDFSPQMQN